MIETKGLQGEAKTLLVERFSKLEVSRSNSGGNEIYNTRIIVSEFEESTKPKESQVHQRRRLCG